MHVPSISCISPPHLHPRFPSSAADHTLRFPESEPKSTMNSVRHAASPPFICRRPTSTVTMGLLGSLFCCFPRSGSRTKKSKKSNDHVSAPPVSFPPSRGRLIPPFPPFGSPPRRKTRYWTTPMRETPIPPTPDRSLRLETPRGVARRRVTRRMVRRARMRSARGKRMSASGKRGKGNG